MSRVIRYYPGDISLTDWVGDNIINDIEKGVYRENPKLSSINSYSKETGVSRDTVEKAYGRLKELGYIKSLPGKGYYVNTRFGGKLRVMILLEDLDAHNGDFCREFIRLTSGYAQTEIRLYLNNAELLQEQIAQENGSHHYYIFWTKATPMPDAHMDTIAQRIPQSRIIRVGERQSAGNPGLELDRVIGQIARPQPGL